ncbi:MAG: hypothetical protein WB710_01840, partial [Stellaceae bacterium]
MLETALAEGFTYHSGLDSFVQRCGIPISRAAKIRERAEKRNKLSGRFAKAPKRLVAQELLRDLGSSAPDDDRILAALITGICKGSFPGANPAARAAISALIESRATERREAE